MEAVAATVLPWTFLVSLSHVRCSDVSDPAAPETGKPTYLGTGTSTSRYLPWVLYVALYGPTWPVFRLPFRHRWFGPWSTKKNVSLPWPLFQTCSSGLHGAPAWVKSFAPPTDAVIAPVATIAPLGHFVSSPASAIFFRLHCGKSLPSALSP